MFVPFFGDMFFMKMCHSKLDHYKYGLCPIYPPSRLNIMINDEIPMKLMSGKVKMKPALKQLTDKNALFVDGYVLKDVDVVLCATGYQSKRPFLSQNIISDDTEQLYLAMFPRQRRTSTIATIGCFRVKGPV